MSNNINHVWGVIFHLKPNRIQFYTFELTYTKMQPPMIVQPKALQTQASMNPVGNSYYRRHIEYPIGSGGAQTVTLRRAGTTRIEFNTPVNVLNNHDIEFQALLTDQAPADGSYSYQAADRIPIAGIQVRTISGQYLLNIEEGADKASQIMQKLLVSQDEYMSKNPSNPLGADDCMQGLCRNNLPVTSSFAIKANGAALNSPSLPYVEPRYLLRGALNTAIPARRISWKLGDIFKRTIFSKEHDIYWGGQSMRITLIFASSNSWSWDGTSANDASVGNTAKTADMVLSDVQLVVPLQDNPKIAEQIVQKQRTSGMSFYYDHTEIRKNNISANAVQNANPMDFTSSDGRSLRQVVTFLTNGVETYATGQDHYNVDASKVTFFQTQIGSHLLQSYEQDVSKYEDYLYMMKYIKGTVLGLGRQVYQTGWCLQDDLVDLPSADKLKGDPSLMLGGVPLSTQPTRYMVKLRMPAAPADGLIVYYVLTFTRLCVINPMGVITVN